MSKPDSDHRVLSNIENKENNVSQQQSVKEPVSGKPDNHYIKNKNMQSPVNKNKVSVIRFTYN